MKKLIFGFVGLVLLSCQDIENCGTDDNRASLIIRFFDIETKDPKKVGYRFTVDGSPYRWSFVYDTTSLIAADTTIIEADTVIVDGEEVITPEEVIITAADTTVVADSTVIVLPINSLTESTTYFFDTDSTSDIMELSYDVSYSIFDESCTRSLVFTNLDTIRHTFDSLSIPGRVTSRQLETNVQIFIK